MVKKFYKAISLSISCPGKGFYNTQTIELIKPLFAPLLGFMMTKELNDRIDREAEEFEKKYGRFARYSPEALKELEEIKKRYFNLK